MPFNQHGMLENFSEAEVAWYRKVVSERFITKDRLFEDMALDIGARTEVPDYPTGIQSLDRVIHGLHRKQLMILAARTSHGKSALAGQMFLHLAKLGKPSVYVSLEMSEATVYERMLCNEYDINSANLRCGIAQEVETAKLMMNDFLLRSIRWPMEVVPIGRRVRDIKFILQEMHPEVLFIDHAQQISQLGYRGKYEALSDYVTCVQSMAIEYNCAIVLLSQINRQGADADHGLNYLKGSGELEECCDQCLKLVWPFRDGKSEDPNEYHINVEKNRHGACEQIKVHFDPRFLKFSELAGPTFRGTTRIERTIKDAEAK